MADEIVGLKLELDTSGATAPMASLKTQIKEATYELVNFTDKFGATSKEAITAAKRVAELKDRMGDARQMVDAFNPDAKFNSLTQALQGAAGGMEAVQGAMGLLGMQSADTEKALLKVQSAMAFSQGLSSFLDGGIEGFKNLYRVISGSVIQAFTALKAAIGSTGIGLLVIALAAVAANWDKIKTAMSGISAEQKKINETAKNNTELEQKKLKHISDQDNVLKLQGKSEKQILDLKLQQIEAVIKATEIQIQSEIATNNAAVAAATRNKQILGTILDIVLVPLNTLLKGIDAIGSAFGKEWNLVDGFKNTVTNLVFDPAQIKADGAASVAAMREQIDNLKNEKAGLQLSAASSGKSSNTKSTGVKGTNENKGVNGEFKQGLFDAIESGLADAPDKELKDTKDKEEEKTNILTIEEEKRQQIIRDSIMLARDAQQQKKQIDALELQSKKDLTAGSIQILSQISTLVGESTQVGKAAAIASTTISTYEAAQSAFKQASLSPLTAASGGVYPYIMAASAVAAGLAKVAAIRKVDAKTGSGGGGSAGGSAPNAPGATVFNTTTKLNKDSIDKINDKALKAYVVETDINSGQKRIERILINTKFK
jgi:hypothetical protein